MKTLVLILILASVGVAQSSSDLQRRFGKPTSETFRVRPDIDMTVSYGITGTACTFVLEPVYDWLGAAKLDEDTTFMKMSVVQEVFDDLVPKSQRGRLVSGPRHGHIEWIYENVILITDGQTDKSRRAAIVFQSGACK